MDFKFNKGGDDAPQTDDAGTAGGKKNQNALLALLLILVGGFSYLYFFTDLIRPKEAPKPVEAPVAEVVKKPLPPRDGTAVTPTETPKAAAPAAVKTEQPKPAEPAKTAAPAEKKAAVVDKKPVAVEKKADQKPAAPEKEKKAEAKPAVPAAKPTEKKPVADLAAKKPVSPAGGTADAAKPAKKPAQEKADTAGPWMVLVGSYLLEDAMAADLAKVRKSGLSPAVVPGGRKKTAMNRLFLAEFKDRPAAQAELDKLKRYTSDAFILDQGGRFGVYAGSYLLDSRAASEKERLAGAGFSLSIKRSDVPIASKGLSAGTFSTRKQADEALKKLKDAGLKATITRP